MDSLLNLCFFPLRFPFPPPPPPPPPLPPPPPPPPLPLLLLLLPLLYFFFIIHVTFHGSEGGLISGVFSSDFRYHDLATTISTM